MTIGGTGLRGIGPIDLEFRYPLTVVSGRNGTGKSTLLALAALAFHQVPGHLPINALRKPKPGENSTYYTFGDFFFRGPGDAAAAGFRWAWTYEDAAGRRTIEMSRSSDKKWMNYERRPARPVHFIGIGRTVPAIERRVLRHHFPIRSTAESDIPLDPEFKPLFERLMQRGYADAAVMQTRGHVLRRVSADVTYSSFNMGAGEDLLIELLFRLQSAPRGALVVIEEIELGLHPAAVRELAQVVQEIAQSKGLQLIVSTHSFDFLDQVPRVARILLQRGGGEHMLMYEPSARYAMGEMTGAWNPELLIACEDDFAAAILNLAMTGHANRRCRVVPIGSSSTLGQFANFHVLLGGQQLLLAWDGDIRDPDIFRMAAPLEGNTRVSWIRLPGELPPEKWAQGVISLPAAIESLADRFKEAPDLMRRCILECGLIADHHGLIYELSRSLSRPTQDVAAGVMDAIRLVAGDELRRIEQQIDAILAGGTVREPALPPLAL